MDLLIVAIATSVAFGLFLLSIKIMRKRDPEEDDDLISEQVKTNSVQLVEAEARVLDMEKEVRKLEIKVAFYEERGVELSKKNDLLKDINEEIKKQKKVISEAKERLEKLQSEKDELFAMVVHDIKNPAAAIQNFVKLLDSYDLNAQDYNEIMVSLVNTSGRLVRLAEDISKVLVLNEDFLKLNLEKHKINDVVNFIKRTHDDSAKRKDVLLTTTLSEDIPDVNCDIERIEEVLDNLIGNAIKFAPTMQKININIETSVNKDNVRVEVKDTGLGIADEDIEFIFEKGAKASNKPTAGEHSTGLGLWIVKKIIDEHKGKVWVETERNKGSNFIFELPIN
ncbi:MAG: HAMP domain-containing histidine kinase [Melioribacteraceae bacterium]|nr:HAMP domain-containing histidine kinase [Melioribacteraceae bacterium]